jgi:hypothetical protein
MMVVRWWCDGSMDRWIDGWTDVLVLPTIAKLYYALDYYKYYSTGTVVVAYPSKDVILVAFLLSFFEFFFS